MNGFTLKLKNEKCGTPEAPFLITVLRDGEPTEVEFKLVELSYWEAGQAQYSSNPAGMACLFGIRNMDGSPMFKELSELDVYGDGLYSISEEIFKLNDRVKAKLEDQAELEKK